MKISLTTFTTLLLAVATMHCQRISNATFNVSVSNCPNINQPMCGIDNNSYQNECMMNKAGIKKAYDGWCNSTSSTISGNATSVVIESKPDLTVFVVDEKNGFSSEIKAYSACVCNATFNPVCGENGVTYANYCRADCKRVKPVHYGQCGAISYDYDPKNTCKCDFSLNPTCGTNGITYENPCVSKCFNATADYNGYCKLPCNCRFLFKPVCGENGKNYTNECMLDCAQINKFSDGLCTNDTKCGKCFGQIKNVCGKDGKSYDNECYMECAGVKKHYDGHCVERWSSNLYEPYSDTYGGYSLGKESDLPTDLDKCFCPKNYLPVCGKNNVTYANECELNCVGVTKMKNGQCKEEQDHEDLCSKNSKSFEYKPVCGSNRVTYYNKSMISCDSGASVLYEGECKPIYYEWCKSSDVIAPVCGIDGRTYLNEDVLKCVGIEKYCDNTCELGANGWKVGPEQKGSLEDSKRADNDDMHFDETVNEYWYNTIWGNHKGEWTCNKTKDTNMACQPQVNIKYMIVEHTKQNGAVVFLPPCRNLDNFDLLYKSDKFPGFQGAIPDAKNVSSIIENSYSKGKKSINNIFENVFNSKNSSVEALNLFMPLNQGAKSEFEVKQKIFENRRKDIPADHKAIMDKNSALYYLYYNLLLKDKVINTDTMIDTNYSVKDALLYIIQDIWRLDFDQVTSNGKDFNIKFDKIMRF